MHNSERLLTITEAAERLGLQPKTLRQRVWKREIPFVRVLGRSIRFRQEVIAQIIADGEVPVRERQ